MNRNVLSVSENTPISETIKILVNNNITGLAVVSDDMSLLGMVTEKDMLRLLSDPDIENFKVADFMTYDVISFDEDGDILELCSTLINNNFRSVPVLSKGKLTGIVSRRDIIKLILLKTSGHGHAHNKKDFDH